MLYASWVAAACVIARFARGWLARRCLYVGHTKVKEEFADVPAPGPPCGSDSEDEVELVGIPLAEPRLQPGPAVAPPVRRRVPGPIAGSVRILFLLGCFVDVGQCVGRVGLSAQELSVSFDRSDIFNGLPEYLVTRVDEILDNRYAPSSMRTIYGGFNKWRTVADAHGWDYIIGSGDPERAAKMATFVCCMMDDTDLVASSIEGYLWGCRVYMTLQHQDDPLKGIPNWGLFMDAVRKLTWVPREPRRAFTPRLVEKMLRWLWDRRDDFRWCQAGFFFLILYCLCFPPI